MSIVSSVTADKNTPYKNSESRSTWIDVLRGIAILAVIYYHAHLQVVFTLNTNLGILTVIDEALRPFRMPILMFLSGFLLPLSFEKSCSAYINGKLRKIAWPYLLWSTANLAVLAIASPLRGETIELAAFAQVFYDPPTYHWYLAYLLVFYLLALLLKRAPWLRTVSIPISLVAATFVEGDLRRILYLWSFFMAGELIARHWREIEPLTSRFVLLGTSAIIAMPALVVSSQGFDLRYDSIWALSVLASVFALLPLAKVLAETKFGEALASVGRNSVVYYVVHYLVITIVFHLLIRIGVENPLILFISSGAAALFIGEALARSRRHRVGAWLFEWAPRKARDSAKAS